ncbi:RNA polymerase sigma factor (sigma-70 family) [Dysgonomonas sp. PFB1-18]|uniref:RNA polymerase sigma factor n=1 Tax=unclassified Dysgonomonas TaxID=2630389 RepID=UPI0024754773|nr:MULTISPECIES: RNA polymerase sigma factor [unclassified Dysgonomonas]MDH6307729.1 RNA polymerase sigma factor (sigma-70 family) [Dysgonomonas sp. PF1-14]MDH6337647.1 RNA polymerase sigma factor (sigma-70 family) [Dysgonomonas sp. PF1-16]MDH6378871.1 RNA polymerase sigma factor (sigma-70 family) [Dysgonomonas sp. PFB1-18]MDH6396506.1 RNA polymerase sigma factor (sigma-70 family) [Dysgonomonas sp. PF1-23]
MTEEVLNMTADLPKEQQSVSDIFKKYRSQLKNYIAKRVMSKEDGEDILQNVFYQLSKIDLIEKPIEQVSAWLYSVANNQIIDRSRKHREVEMPYVKTQDDDELFLSEVTSLLMDEDASPETEYLRTLVWDELEAALSELPPEQREVFDLTEMEGFSFKEIAETMDIPVNTLISRKRYAVLHLRERLRTLYEELLEG